METDVFDEGPVTLTEQEARRLHAIRDYLREATRDAEHAMRLVTSHPRFGEVRELSKALTAGDSMGARCALAIEYIDVLLARASVESPPNIEGKGIIGRGDPHPGSGAAEGEAVATE